jgi:phosphatidylserine/phosphatidylglycerophosphate/cardiolipin synthase-like enzyme
VFLTDGGQSPDVVLERLVAFIDAARTSLDIAIYDAHLDDGAGGRVITALDEAEARGVKVRAVYNDEHRRAVPVPPPPTGPSTLASLAAAIPSTAIPGIPDLMHNKYMVRDGDTVWTGSTNWTIDSWTGMENVIVVVPSADLAAAFTQDFEQLWTRRHVEGTGGFDDEPAHVTFAGEPLTVRALFAPGRGRAIGHLVGRRIATARARVRICSPVLTSGPILSTLAEVLDDAQSDVLVTLDGPQMREVMAQWERDGRAAWKRPLVERILASGRVALKRSRPFQAGPPRDYMHAKVVVCDDIVLTGSYNLSHSGEMNAENLLEIQSTPFADDCAGFCERVHARYAAKAPG